MVLSVFSLPLILMSVIYVRIFVIISRHQRGRRPEHKRSTNTASSTAATNAATAALVSGRLGTIPTMGTGADLAQLAIDDDHEHGNGAAGGSQLAASSNGRCPACLKHRQRRPQAEAAAPDSPPPRSDDSASELSRDDKSEAQGARTDQLAAPECSDDTDRRTKHYLAELGCERSRAAEEDEARGCDIVRANGKKTRLGAPARGQQQLQPQNACDQIKLLDLGLTEAHRTKAANCVPVVIASRVEALVMERRPEERNRRRRRQQISSSLAPADGHAHRDAHLGLGPRRASSQVLTGGDLNLPQTSQVGPRHANIDMDSSSWSWSLRPRSSSSASSIGEAEGQCAPPSDCQSEASRHSHGPVIAKGIAPLAQGSAQSNCHTNKSEDSHHRDNGVADAWDLCTCDNKLTGKFEGSAKLARANTIGSKAATGGAHRRHQVEAGSVALGGQNGGWRQQAWKPKTGALVTLSTSSEEARARISPRSTPSSLRKKAARRAQAPLHGGGTNTSSLRETSGAGRHRESHTTTAPTTKSGAHNNGEQLSFHSTSTACGGVLLPANSTATIHYPPNQLSTTTMQAPGGSALAYEPQRRHVHAQAVPQTNTKALVTTLLILGTYFISYVPAIIYQVLTCIDHCPYPLYDISFSRRVLFGAMTTLLLIAKSVVDPLIYSYRMNEIQLAISRYLSKRRSKSATQHGASLHTSQRCTNTYVATAGGQGGAHYPLVANCNNNHHATKSDAVVY